MNNDLVILGAGGHAKVIADIAKKSGYRVLGFLDDNAKAKEILCMPVLGKIEDCVKFPECEFVIAIGNNAVRKAICEKYPLRFATLIHPSAQIGMDVNIGEGTVIMANAVVNPSAVIGKHSIINTSSVVEHDCSVGDFVHISPRAVLCGTVTVGDNVHIGTGATVINNITICGDSMIGAGATVVKNITEKGTYIGIPAKIMTR